jgi:hypothetical protein
MHTLLPRLRTILPLLVLLLISSVVLIALDRPLVRGDGTAYLAWVDTLIIDRDLSLQNQVDKLASVNTYQVAWNDATNDWAIVFPFGIAFLQAPFYALGHIFAQNDWLNYNPTYFFQNQGVALPYSLWLMAGANFMALGIISAAWWAGRRFANGWLTALTVFAVFIGTPLVYYSTIDPLNSHNGAGFTMAILIWILVIQTNAFARDDDDTHTPRLWLWVLMGIMAGMTIMTRWQLAVSVAPVWLLLAYKREWRGFWDCRHQRRRDAPTFALYLECYVWCALRHPFQRSRKPRILADQQSISACVGKPLASFTHRLAIFRRIALAMATR